MSVFNSSGPYEFQGSVPPEDCDKLWLYVEADDGPGVHSRYLLDGCGEHTLNIDIANNIQVTGTVTLDGSPYVGQIGVAVGQMPPDFETRRIRSTGSNVAGEYAFSASFDPAYCDDLWVWLIGDTVDHLEKIPGCGPQVVDVDAAVADLWNAVPGQDLLGRQLVHGQRRTQHPGTHIGDVGQLQEALHRAVLAQRAVKERENDQGSVGGEAGEVR